MKISNQLVITECDKENVTKFSGDELFKNSTKLEYQLNEKDDDVWGKYNYIKMP